MSLSINNNITALNAWRNLKSTDGSLSKSMEKLSSGLRINRAADDPASLVISEKMRAQLAGIDAAVKNSEKAVNMIQTAEAALDKVGKLLVKVRQLALDTANTGINDDAMLAANQAELDEAIASITRIGDYTQFGTKKLLDGSLGGTVEKSAASLAVDSTFDLVSATTQGHDGEAVTLSITQAATQGDVAVTVNTAGGTLVIDGVSFTVSDQGAASQTASVLVTSVNLNTDVTDKYTVTWSSGGVFHIKNESWGTTQDTAAVSGSAQTAATATAGIDLEATLTVGSEAPITMDQGTGLTLADADGNTIAVASSSNAVASAVVGTIDDNSAVFQIGPNESQTVVVGINSTKAISLGKVAVYDDADGNTDQAVTAFRNLDELTSSGGHIAGGVFKSGNADQLAQAIGVIDKAIDDVATLRGDLGAVQADNLQVQLDSLRVAYENLQASESTIRDADMTLEMATFTKYQIMMQAGTAMLAQANQQPNNILRLIQG